MDKAQRKILRSPSVKRKSKALPIGQRVSLTSSVHVCVCHLAAKVDWEWDRLSCFTIVLNRRVIFKRQK